MDVVTAGTKTNERKLTYLSHDQKQSHPFLGMFTLPEDAILMPFDDKNYPNHEGIDFYGHFKEDIKLFAEMGFNGYRMSISWSRIFPNGDDDQPNEEGLKFYDAIFDELLNYKIQPIVTISHYETPLALVNKWNGWADRRTIGCFMKYCQVILTDTKIKSNTG